jgi:hypothetical protein
MTSDLVSPRKSESKPARELSPEQAAAAAMVAEAKARGLALTGPDGLLKLFTKNVLETALNEEMTEHLGHEKNQADPDRESTNVRNGTRPKTVAAQHPVMRRCLCWGVLRYRSRFSARSGSGSGQVRLSRLLPRRSACRRPSPGGGSVRLAE